MMGANLVMDPETSGRMIVQGGEGNHSHFMGIEGAGMFALAELFRLQGEVISGCDIALGDNSEQLRSHGVGIWDKHNESHLSGVNSLIVSSAVSWETHEVQEAIRLGIPVMKRAEALGQCVNEGQVLAVSGTHGKTTTTAMLTEILAVAGMNPTGVAGGYVWSWDGNILKGGNDLFVVEADEYDRSFLALEPNIAIVNNIEADHLDCYHDFDEIVAAFRQFLESLPSEGTAVVCADDKFASRVVNGLQRKIVTYGINPGTQIRATEVQQNADGVVFTILEYGVNVGSFWIKSLGMHNLQNTLAAVASSRSLGVSWEVVREGLESFGGVKRRFEKIGLHRNILVMDDYAHHPSEVTATLTAAKTCYPDRRLVALFQPHLFTRTRDFATDFASSLLIADEIWVTGIFASREDPIEGVTGELIANCIQEAGGSVRYQDDMSLLSACLIQSLEPGDLFVTLGAGSIRQVSEEIELLLRHGDTNG